MIYYFFILLMALLGATASLFLKKASGLDGIVTMIKDKNIYIGGILYVSSAVMNIYVLHFLPYSVVLPLTALTYVWTMLLSYFLLKEGISFKKIMGVCFILIGAVLVSL